MPYDTQGMTDADGNPVYNTATPDSGAQQASPDMMHRILDWLGRQFGGDSGSGMPGHPASQSAQDAWYNNVAASPSPFGGTPYGPPQPDQPQYKPVTKISSADDIAKLVGSMLGGPSEGYHPLTPVADPSAAPGAPGPVPDFNMGPLPPRNAPVNMDDPNSLGVAMAGPGLGSLGNRLGVPVPGYAPQMARSANSSHSKGRYLPDFDLIHGGPTPDRSAPDVVTAGGLPAVGRTSVGRWLSRGRGNPADYPGVVGDSAAGSPFGTGGVVHGYMRGGYPDVYGSGPPIRHTFNSGGENYVGGHYGDSDGRADDVNAKLSPKEYVMDAESMAMLGDGNPDAGAKKMDEMRANLRAHKGAALAKGKFSPKAKSPQEYLVGNPMGDGLRRRGRDK